MRREQELRIQKLKAIVSRRLRGHVSPVFLLSFVQQLIVHHATFQDERRVVYVGRICRSMTHDELRERFSQFGEVECVSLHFRERGSADTSLLPNEITCENM